MGGFQILFGNFVRKGGVGRSYFVPFQALFGSFSTLFIPIRSFWAKVLQGKKKQAKSVKSDKKWRIRPIVVR